MLIKVAKYQRLYHIAKPYKSEHAPCLRISICLQFLYQHNRAKAYFDANRRKRYTIEIADLFIERTNHFVI